MAAWGIVAAPAAVDPSPATDPRLAGVVAVPVGGDGPLGRFAAALRLVPPDADRLVLLDAPGPEGHAAGEAATDPVALLDLLDADHAAVVRVDPVTDALKRVDADVVVAGVDRADLFRPGPTRVVRRSDLAAVLRDGVPAGAEDPAPLLLAAGRAVRAVPGSGAPFTVHGAVA